MIQSLWFMASWEFCSGLFLCWQDKVPGVLSGFQVTNLWRQKHISRTGWRHLHCTKYPTYDFPLCCVIPDAKQEQSAARWKIQLLPGATPADKCLHNHLLSHSARQIRLPAQFLPVAMQDLQPQQQQLRHAPQVALWPPPPPMPRTDTIPMPRWCNLVWHRLSPSPSSVSSAW